MHIPNYNIKYLWLELKNLLSYISVQHRVLHISSLQVQNCREMNKAEKSISVVLFTISSDYIPKPIILYNPMQSPVRPWRTWVIYFRFYNFAKNYSYFDTCILQGVSKKRRPLEIKHIVKIWMPFQLQYAEPWRVKYWWVHILEKGDL
jgi:hypothetical protein